jgi:hypothetical protein
MEKQEILIYAKLKEQTKQKFSVD